MDGADTENDSQLLKRWRKGDNDAFARLYRRYSRGLFMYLRSIVARAEVAEELLQETFMQLVRNWRKVRHREDLSPYLATVARNRATDWLRRHRLEAGHGGNTGGHLSLIEDSTPAESGGELTALEANELLWGLPDKQREAVILRIYSGLTFEDVARVTGVPLSTAISRYRYGLDKLRKALKEDGCASERRI